MKDMDLTGLTVDEQTVHLSRADAKRRKAVGWCSAALIIGGLVTLGILALLASGCTMLGANAKAPGRFEESLFTVTNVPMVTVHILTNTVTVTNFVPKEVVTTNVVTVVNEKQEMVPVYVTVTNTVQAPQVTTQTNIIPAGTLVQVPQLVAPTATLTTGTGIVSGIAGMFGWGGVASTVLTGLAAGWMRNRNRALAASYTGASATANAAQQAGAALVQQIETLLEVLKSTPQGQAVAPAVVQFLQGHQVETGTVATVAEFIRKNVDNEAARNAAGDILESVNDLRGLLASDSAKPKVA